MRDYKARKRLKQKMLDRWENEGGRIAADSTTRLKASLRKTVTAKVMDHDCVGTISRRSVVPISNTAHPILSDSMETDPPSNPSTRKLTSSLCVCSAIT